MSKKQTYQYRFNRFGPVTELAEEIMYGKMANYKDLNKLKKAIVEKLKMIDQESTIPAVGKGVTVHVGSDRYAGTITKVSKSGKSFEFVEDKYEARHRGLTESQSYDYSIDLNDGKVKTAKFSRATKSFVSNGRWVSVGHRSGYRDPSF